jgi:DNA-binding transcriptional MerR regulator
MDKKAFRRALTKIDLRSPRQIALDDNKIQILAALDRGVSLATIHKLMVENGFKGSKKIVEGAIKEWRGEPVKQRKTPKKEATPTVPAPQSETQQSQEVTEKEPEAPAPPSGRVNLSVPYEENEEVKQLGAKWDGEKKTWYVPAGIDPGAFSRWLPD